MQSASGSLYLVLLFMHYLQPQLICLVLVCNELLFSFMAVSMTEIIISFHVRRNLFNFTLLQ